MNRPLASAPDVLWLFAVTWLPVEPLVVDREVTLGEATENHLADGRVLRQRLAGRGDGNLGGWVDRISIDPGTDAREGQTGNPVLLGEFNGAAVTGGEQFSFTLLSAMPYWADRMNYVTSSQVVALGQLRVAGPAASEETTGVMSARMARSMDDDPSS